LNTVYLDKLVIKFFTKKKQQYYKVLQWTKDGMAQFTLETGKFDGDIEKLKSRFKDEVMRK
jgi:hypothetical protein